MFDYGVGPAAFEMPLDKPLGYKSAVVPSGCEMVRRECAVSVGVRAAPAATALPGPITLRDTGLIQQRARLQPPRHDSPSLSPGGSACSRSFSMNSSSFDASDAAVLNFDLASLPN